MQDTHTNGHVELKSLDLNRKLSSNDEEKKILQNDVKDKVDDVQEAMGDFGMWQLLICLAISFVKFPVAWHQLVIVFMAPKPEFKCIFPFRSNGSDHCFAEINGTIEECSEWEYDRSIFTETIITQWNLVCSRSHYADYEQSILMFGVLVGNMLFGSLADRYGRKIPLVSTVLIQVVSGILCAVVPWFPALVLLKLFCAIATGGTMVTSFVICMEIVGTEWRAAITVLYQIPFSLGHASLAGLSYWLRNWQHLQLAISLPSIILLSYWWIVPESPKWLLAMGRQRAACKILQTAANVNKIKHVDIPEMVRQHCLHQHSKRSASDHQASFFDLFRTPNMRVKSLAIFFNWIVCGMGLFGMVQYLGNVKFDLFVIFAVSGAMQIPGNIVSLWAMTVLGRKITLITSHTIAGVAFLLLIIVPAGSTWLTFMLACFGIVGMSISFTTAYLFSGELFPTVVRNIGVGTSSMSARIGSMVAPFVVHLDSISYWIPLAVFGALPLIGAALVLLLPETAGSTLPETLEDGEAFGKKFVESDRRKDAEAHEPAL